MGELSDSKWRFHAFCEGRRNISAKSGIYRAKKQIYQRNSQFIERNSKYISELPIFRQTHTPEKSTNLNLHQQYNPSSRSVPLQTRTFHFAYTFLFRVFINHDRMVVNESMRHLEKLGL